MIASFARQTVTRQRGDASTDSYGNETIDWSDPDEITVYPVRLDPVVGAETFDVQGRRVVSRWSMSAPISADITDADRIKHDGSTYDIDGTVQRFTSPSGHLDHLELVLKKVEDS